MVQILMVALAARVVLAAVEAAVTTVVQAVLGAEEEAAVLLAAQVASAVAGVAVLLVALVASVAEEGKELAFILTAALAALAVEITAAGVPDLAAGYLPALGRSRLLKSPSTAIQPSAVWDLHPILDQAWAAGFSFARLELGPERLVMLRQQSVRLL